MNFKIRVANISDAKSIHDMYGYYVNNSNNTFTTINPSIDDYAKKIEETKKFYPFYVAENEEKVIGYTYGSRLRPHDAYLWNVESTIILSPETPRRQGIATALYNKLMETLTHQGFKAIYGVVTDTNIASIEFHKALGFTETGHLENSGFKNNTWLGVYFFRKFLSDFEEAPQQIIPFCNLN